MAVGFGSSFQLLSRGFSFRHDGEDGRWKREEGEQAGKHALLNQTAGMTERASTPLSICLSDPQGRDEEVAQEGPKQRKGVHFGTYKSGVSVHASPRGAHPGFAVLSAVSISGLW